MTIPSRASAAGAPRPRRERQGCDGLSPIGHAHLNFLGRYAISASAPADGLRRLGEIPDLPDDDRAGLLS
ncbi:hypothetical protein [Nonomuraea sp. CA-141351]|uniref:hypothetical protein n=1 Tax=Nonomuraea sp. CA-141351 TaxID=3239996 RepID=UPI003D947007